MRIPLVDLKAQYRSLKKEMDRAVGGVLARGEFILGSEVKAFEREFGAWCGAKHALGVADCTDALYLALAACGVGSGDEVILPANTFIATAEAVVRCGARPVFADVNPDTYTMDPESMKRAVTRKTKAVIPVHLFGQPADMRSILALANKHDLRVVEDCAQAHGARYRGKRVGTLGDAGCFSFYPSKNLGGCGDGGMVVTNNKNIAGKIWQLRSHGRSRENKYLHELEGTNSRLDEVQAAILRVKLRHLDRWNAKRRAHAARYDTLLRDVEGIALPPMPTKVTEPVYYFYVVRVARRDAVQQELAKRGVATEVHYPLPLHLQPVYKKMGYRAGDFPQAERAAREILSMPVYPELSSARVAYAARALRAAVLATRR